MIKVFRFSLALFACVVNLCVLSSVVFFLFFIAQLLRLLSSRRFYEDIVAVYYNAVCDRLIRLHSRNLRCILTSVCGVTFHRYFSRVLCQDKSYVMVVNHRSHVDILVILAVFYDQIPNVKFFLKRSLLWVPFLGQFCYLMNYVFVRKIKKNLVRRNPGIVQKQRDLISQQCRDLVKSPVTLAVFAEGTRYVSEKKLGVKNIFRNLLAPQPAGIALALEASSKHISDLLDITLVYDVGFVSAWLLLSGQVNDIEIHAQTFDVAKSNLVGDYVKDRNYRKYFSEWVRTLWQRKDELLTQSFLRLSQRREMYS